MMYSRSNGMFLQNTDIKNMNLNNNNNNVDENQERNLTEDHRWGVRKPLAKPTISVKNARVQQCRNNELSCSMEATVCR